MNPSLKGRRYMVPIWPGGSTPRHCGKDTLYLGLTQWSGLQIWACYRCSGAWLRPIGARARTHEVLSPPNLES